MPRFGTHASSAGGVALAVARAYALGCKSVQVFTRNPNQWRAPALSAGAVSSFRAAREYADLRPAVSHASYLINLASATDPLRTLSFEALADELDRAEQLGLEGVVLHPGTRSAGQSEADALDRIAAAVSRLFASRRRHRVRLLFEHTAGQGGSVGCTFEQLEGLLDRLGGSPHVGICLDTCHLLAAGYDIAIRSGYRLTFRHFDRVVGLDRLAIFHVNDSKRPCGSHVDRHAHIGEGFLGLEPFRWLVNDRRFRTLPMVLETEKRPVRTPTSVVADPLDAINLSRLRSLVRRTTR